jgi:hypothetical protein
MGCDDVDWVCLVENIVACKPITRQRPVTSSRGTGFSVRSLLRCYEQDG